MGLDYQNVLGYIVNKGLKPLVGSVGSVGALGRVCAQWTMYASLLLIMMSLAPTGAAQAGQCPRADGFMMPIDTAQFVNVQGYGVRSVRHDGLYHAGEDWHLPNGNSAGQMVRAAANGRVIYAYPQGWGRDGGVVILEHELTDDTLAYSVYGHIGESGTATFPTGNSCVSMGDVLGVIVDARPAPHLHFEIRTGNVRTPGGGYTRTPPDAEGYRHPSQFVVNWQARLSPVLNWVTTLGAVQPIDANPLSLNDNSLLTLEPERVTRILPDGRILWRTRLSTRAVAVTGWQGNALLHLSDGMIQVILPDGTLGEFWRVPIAPTGAPFPLDDALVFPLADGSFAALDRDRRQVLWQSAPLGAVMTAVQGAQTLGLRTPSHEWLTVRTADRALLHRAQLSVSASAAAAPDGTLWVYTQGGLWQVLNDGVWQAVETLSAPPVTGSSGIAFDARGDAYLFDGETLHAFNSGGVLQWQARLGAVEGRVALHVLDGRLLLLATDGSIITVSPSGNVCRVQVWGAEPHSRLWYALGTDGVLRVQIGGTFAGVSWERFSLNCPV